MQLKRVISKYDLTRIAALGRGLRKRVYQWLFLDKKATKQIVFIFGCQRSGTTMLMHCFRRDFRTELYGESGLAKQGQRLRLRSYDGIEQIIAKARAPLAIAKPIVESQNARELLGYFVEAKAIWMYRDYRDVANSSLSKFGPESMMKNLRPMVHDQLGPHWASEGISEDTRAIVTKYFREDMLPYDAEALFWYARNVLFYEQGLDKHPRTMLCRYEDIVSEPQGVMRDIYRFIGYEYPGDHVVAGIHDRSIGLGRNAEVSQGIRDLCTALLQRMDETYASRSDRP